MLSGPLGHKVNSKFCLLRSVYPIISTSVNSVLLKMLSDLGAHRMLRCTTKFYMELLSHSCNNKELNAGVVVAKAIC